MPKNGAWFRGSEYRFEKIGYIRFIIPSESWFDSFWMKVYAAAHEDDFWLKICRP